MPSRTRNTIWNGPRRPARGLHTAPATAALHADCAISGHAIMEREAHATMAWFAILKHTPAILAAAEALFQRTKTSRANDHTRSIEIRLDELAESSRASADLMQDMARQLQALAMSHDATERKVRTATRIGVAGSVVAVAAVVIAVAR